MNLVLIQLVKTKKPTGDGKRPYFVTKAKHIDRLINEKVATRHIDDPELDNNFSGVSDGECSLTAQDEEAKMHTVVARNGRSEIPERRRTRGQQAADFVSKIATALDPETQRTRDEERANRSLQNTQFFTLTQQLRDSQQRTDSLHSELSRLRDRLHKVERIRDRLDMELNFERRLAGMAAESNGRPPRTRKHCPDLERVRGKVRSTITYPEGGSFTTWVTDGSSASDYDAEKENFNPLINTHHSSPRPSSPLTTNIRYKHSTPSLPAGTSIPSTAASTSAPLISQPSFEI
jgi:hypothetical protein